MYLWLSKGRSLNQLKQRCFCQGSSIYAQHFVSYKKLSFIKDYSISSLLNKIPVNCTSYSLYTNYDTIRTMSEQSMRTSSDNQEVPQTTPTALSKKDKLKRAVKDYGATVVVFHVAISLTSLGISYLVISSGVDVASLLQKIGVNSTSDIATGASTFVVAYALHKVFAPVRISITLGATPFIVRYLRRVGILKPPKSTAP